MIKVDGIDVKMEGNGVAVFAEYVLAGVSIKRKLTEMYGKEFSDKVFSDMYNEIFDYEKEILDRENAIGMSESDFQKGVSSTFAKSIMDL